MRILASTRCLAKPPTGIGHYTAQTLNALATLPGVTVREFPSRWVWPLARYRERHLDWWQGALKTPVGGFSTGKITHSVVSRLERFFLRQHDKADWFTAKFSDVYFEPNHELMPSTLPTVGAIYDLSVLRFPHWHPAERVAQHRAYFDALFNRGDSVAVVTISEAVRREIVEMLGIAPERVVTGCCAARKQMCPGRPRSDAKTLNGLGLQAGYFLHVGTLEPRKNLAMLVRAWSSLDISTRKNHPLVLAGGKGWGDEDLQTELRRAPDGIHHLGYVREAYIPALYRGALSLVMPTHYEGYGMPVIEMRAAGGAVITSLDPAVREVAGEDTPAIDAQDGNGWTEAMRRAADEPTWLEEQRANGPAWAGRHTWLQGAQAVLAAAHAARGSLPADLDTLAGMGKVAA